MVLPWIYEHWVELFGTVSGLAYLYLEIRQKPAMWVLGFITSLVYVVVFFKAKFYADMGLNVYYVGISIYGFWLWKTRISLSLETSAQTDSQLPAPSLFVRRVPLWLGVKLGLASAGLFVLIGYLLDRFTDSPIPYHDALTTALSMVATWMLARKYLDHWFVWIFVNFFSMYLYIWRGLYPTSLLFFFYGIMSFVGYAQWKKTLPRQTSLPRP